MRDPTAQRLLQHWVDLVGDLLLRPHPTMPIERLLAAAGRFVDRVVATQIGETWALP